MVVKLLSNFECFMQTCCFSLDVILAIYPATPCAQVAFQILIYIFFVSFQMCCVTQPDPVIGCQMPTSRTASCVTSYSQSSYGYIIVGVVVRASATSALVIAGKSRHEAGITLSECAVHAMSTKRNCEHHRCSFYDHDVRIFSVRYDYMARETLWLYGAGDIMIMWWGRHAFVEMLVRGFSNWVCLNHVCQMTLYVQFIICYYKQAPCEWIKMNIEMSTFKMFTCKRNFQFIKWVILAAFIHVLVRSSDIRIYNYTFYQFIC
jgi:hypothetical protein